MGNRSRSSRSNSSRSHSSIEALEAYNHWLSATDKRAKYDKMSQSPFRFYRGTNHIFWADLANDERLTSFSHDQTKIWVQGDLHTENYGAYHNDDGEVVYSLNDFDEAVVADYQLDLWRMAISIVLVARQSKVRRSGKWVRLSDSDSAMLVDTFVEAYLDTLASYRGNRDEDKVVFTSKSLPKTLNKLVDKIEDRNTHQTLLNEWTLEIPAQASTQTTSTRCFNISRCSTKLQPVQPEEWEAIAQQFSTYGQTLIGNLDYDDEAFQILDIAKRINAGTGSLGALRYYVLIAGNPQKSGQERILDVKSQGVPITYNYMAEGDRHCYDQHFGHNHALRHAIAYRALTNNTDDYLGWMELNLLGHRDRYFSVRELSPYKKAFDTSKLAKIKNFEAVAKTWGKILATAHARSDKDFDDRFISYSFDQQIDQITDGHHKKFRKLVRAIAFEYADQVHTDWDQFIGSSLVKP